jgi:hypothetical protein
MVRKRHDRPYTIDLKEVLGLVAQLLGHRRTIKPPTMSLTFTTAEAMMTQRWPKQLQGFAHLT